MKRLSIVLLLSVCIVLPCLSIQSNSDREVARTQEYIAATQKKGAAKISALNAYIKKFPETTSRWTRLALYSLVIEYFQSKNYAQAIKQGEKRIQMGNFGSGEEARLELVLAESCGLVQPPQKDKARAHINKAISLAKSGNDKNVLSAAQKLKSQLAGPPPKKISPEQKIKRHYSLEEYSEAVSAYNSFGASDKNNPEIKKVYANSLFKANRYNTAIPIFKALYEADKKGVYAYRLGTMYSKNARRNKSLYDTSVKYFIEAGLLYKKEGANTNSKTAYGKAKGDLGIKYNFEAQRKAVEKKMRASQNQAKQNAALIKKTEREIRRAKRAIDRYEMENDMEAPPDMYTKHRNLEKKLNDLKSGVSSDTSADIDKINKLSKQIDKEIEDLKAMLKKELKL